MLASNKEGQALFKAIGFIGVSDPEDKEDVDEGDILEDDVVRPRGRQTLLFEDVVVPAGFALVKIEPTGDA